MGRVYQWLRKHKLALFFLAMSIFFVVYAIATSPNRDVPTTAPISRLYSDLSAHRVESVEISNPNNDATVTLRQGDKYLFAYTTGYGPELMDQLKKDGVHTTVKDAGFFQRYQWLVGTVPLLLVVVIFMLFANRGGLRFGRSRGLGVIRPVDPPKERFSDVRGVDEIIEDIRQIVDALRNPGKYRGRGVRPLTGFLFYGGPGTGKTLLARAIAGEAGVPFFSLKGSDFAGQWLNDGPRLVREVFAQVRKFGVAIVFIDEIDSIGARRSSQDDSGSKELNNTLNELLAQLDGFGTSDEATVLVIGATNRPDDLDPSLKRPGRMTKHAYLPSPDRPARQLILELHSRRLTGVAEDVDYERLAGLTSGMTGAQLADIVNQAGLLAIREGEETKVAMRHFVAALETAEFGVARNRAVAERDRVITAIHESGHTVVAWCMPQAPRPHRVSIIPRGMSGGHTAIEPDDDQYLTRAQLRARLAVLMAGRAAEKLLLDGDFTTGAEHDLERATEIARFMVCRAGMGSTFIAQVDTNSPGHDPRIHEIAREVDQIVREAEEAATALLQQRHDDLVRLRDQLLEVETLDEAALDELLGLVSS